MHGTCLWMFLQGTSRRILEGVPEESFEELLERVFGGNPSKHNSEESLIKFKNLEDFLMKALEEFRNESLRESLQKLMKKKNVSLNDFLKESLKL